MRKYAIRLMLGLFIPAVLGLTACGGGGSSPVNPPPPVSNTLPVANAGANQTVLVGTVVTLDGSKSAPTPLNYSWSFTSPTANKPILDITDPVKPTFTASVAGVYVISLVVNDGKVASLPSTVTVTAINNTGSMTVTW